MAKHFNGGNSEFGDAQGLRNSGNCSPKSITKLWLHCIYNDGNFPIFKPLKMEGLDKIAVITERQYFTVVKFLKSEHFPFHHIFIVLFQMHTEAMPLLISCYFNLISTLISVCFTVF